MEKRKLERAQLAAIKKNAKKTGRQQNKRDAQGPNFTVEDVNVVCITWKCYIKEVCLYDVMFFLILILEVRYARVAIILLKRTLDKSHLSHSAAVGLL